MSHTHEPFEPFTRIGTLREHLLAKLLRETLKDLEWLEGTSKTSAVRRALIADIEYVTR